METVQRPDGVNQKSRVPRREFLRLGAIGGAAVAAGAVASTWMPDLRKRGLLSAEGVFEAVGGNAEAKEAAGEHAKHDPKASQTYQLKATGAVIQ